ncbi:DUF4105 domain-containing protein [Leptospira ilyithenensis]|uniref:DUF4105 domain-containing protein n=1 Tax=Leptospira ilyithenensis TaxID=2484901 RepID=A0A4R9LJJ9_9LEPT|nr:DUF4105 domain-containing protein [Leptospira ilyithenensis]TGN07056.1 DUF4105 domain-containing protein [Leptospira ilyithenensis]
MSYRKSLFFVLILIEVSFPCFLISKDQMDNEKPVHYDDFLPSDPDGKKHLSSLLLQIENQKTYEEKHWINLIRYKKNIFGVYISEVDSEYYFLSNKGNENPKKELFATLRSFFAEEDFDSEEILHPQCSFPERYDWLKKQLGFDAKVLKERKCKRFEAWKEALGGQGLRIVFSSYYMQSPGSMFGHTLIKVDSQFNESSELLDYGVGFAANTGDVNIVYYMFGGLTGRFPGTFSIFPYYLKVNEYNDLENRDLWEYKLNLDEEERARFLRHLWEMRRSHFDYFFLSENCSYHLLGMFDVAGTNLSLSSKAGSLVSPADTIKLYLGEKDLVAGSYYRPSMYSKIKQKLVAMTDLEKEYFWDLLSGKVNYADLEGKEIRRSLVIDAILEAYRYKQIRSKKEEEDPLYEPTLHYRSKLTDTYSLNESIPVSIPPEFSHSLSRASVSLGTSSLGTFTQLQYRVAYHDLLNANKGHSPNSELQFFNGTIRKYEFKPMEFTSMSVLRVLSLSPYNSLSKHLSYLFDVGWDTVLYKEKDPIRDNDIIRKQAGNLEGLVGYSFQNEFKNFNPSSTFSVLIGGKAQGSAVFQNGVRYGPEIMLNYLWEMGDWKLQLASGYYYFQASRETESFLNTAKIRYSITKNHELRLEVASQRLYDELLFSYQYLF